jgi:hypothetical protein
MQPVGTGTRRHADRPCTCFLTLPNAGWRNLPVEDPTVRTDVGVVQIIYIRTVDVSPACSPALLAWITRQAPQGPTILDSDLVF